MKNIEKALEQDDSPEGLVIQAKVAGASSTVDDRKGAFGGNRGKVFHTKNGSVEEIFQSEDYVNTTRPSLHEGATLTIPAAGVAFTAEAIAAIYHEAVTNKKQNGKGRIRLVDVPEDQLKELRSKFDTLGVEIVGEEETFRVMNAEREEARNVLSKKDEEEAPEAAFEGMKA